MSDVAEVLQKAFPGLEGDGLDNLMAVARRRFYPSDTVIVREEEAGYSFFVVLEGLVEVSQRIDGESRRVLQRHGPGEFFGEMALIEEMPRVATVQTLTPSTLLEIHKDDFDSALSQHPAMALTVMRKLTQRLRQADQRAIAELRRKNEQLSQAYRELAEQERLRSEFLTTIAHELRTPLTGASGYLSLVASGKLSDEQKQEGIERATRNIRRVVKLVNDILFLQEMDLILPEFRPVSLRELISQAVAERSQQAVAANLSLRVDLAEDLPQVEGDPDWLRRAIDALLDNAIKFSPDGGEISIRAVRQSGQARLFISDQGVGIPADQMDRVFARFQRIERAGPHLFGGVGLGLPVAKQVVEQHGGTIEVHSVEGHGSTFVLSLPAAGQN